MKHILFYFLFGINTLGICQTNALKNSKLSVAEKEVMAVVLKVFDGMREGDSAKVGSCFTDAPSLFTSFTNGKTGEHVLSKGNIEEFLKSVGTPHEKIYDEPIWDYEVRISDNLAQVWTSYAFYLGNEFQHCGVDAFHLHKEKQGWKIFQLVDTRKKKGCSIPEFIKNQKGN